VPTKLKTSRKQKKIFERRKQRIFFGFNALPERLQSTAGMAMDSIHREYAKETTDLH
jgi:hypothetical protein